MKENLVFTISIGDYYKNISKLTSPSIEKYSKKINADFLNITNPNINYIINNNQKNFYQKFNIYDLLNKYKRILYLDIDLIIRDDCPNLFDIVPLTKIGMVNESTFESRSFLIELAKNYGSPLKKWNGKYFNTGVMVISRLHKPLFKFPKNNNIFLEEESYINLKIINDKIKTFDLDWKFNRISIMDNFIGKSRLDSYIVHYNKAPKDQIFPILINDIKQWENDKPEYNYSHNILISVSAGMGDQLCSEPAIRYTKKIYPDSNFYIVTHYPRLFEHLEMPVFHYDEWKGIKTPIYTMYTCPDEKKSENNLSHAMFHPVDFATISMIKRTIPLKEKNIKLKLISEDTDSILNIIGDKSNKKPLILVHAGKWWPSKTFPIEWWQDIVNKLSNKLTVGLIGKTIDNKQGYLPIELPKGGIDFRDLTTLSELISLISISNCVLTNDSSPLHIAGAFDNWIVVIPTSKSPEHILPFRNGNQYYKVKTLYKKILIDDLETRHTTYNADTIDIIPKNKTIYDYLPNVEDVVKTIFTIYNL